MSLLYGIQAQRLVFQVRAYGRSEILRDVVG